MQASLPLRLLGGTALTNSGGRHVSRAQVQIAALPGGRGSRREVQTVRAPRSLRAGADSLQHRRRAHRARPAAFHVQAALAGVEAAQELGVSGGSPEPLGPSRPADGSAGVNFSVFSKRSTSVSLCLYLDPDAKEATAELPMKRTGDHWHLQVANISLAGVRYGFRVDGQGGWDAGDRWDKSRVLIDPYGPLVTGRDRFADKSKMKVQWLSSFDMDSPPFDWQGVAPPNIPFKDIVIYEMSVRHFTADPSSQLPDGIRGSYLGLIEKIPHLLQLGVNAIEILPVYEFDELEFAKLPNPREHLINSWGYSTLSFFAPMTRFGTGRGAAAASVELKTMIRELHRAGIEVILDVVYNHTAEGDDSGEPFPTSFRGLDNQEYYMLERSTHKANFFNYSGCGNTVNANNGATKRMILDSLRHWRAKTDPVTEYHVDGFRFDLASALTRGSDGTPLASPPLIREMTHCPVLSRCKLIAEPWDCGGLYQVGSFPNWDRWAEWNGRYRDDVRRFVKGDAGHKSKLATRISGSADMYRVNQRKPYHSINFIIAHDGFTLRDLVSYNVKHNERNGENGRDGCNDNDSWNCGAEGPTADEGINAQRNRMMRSFHLILMLSQGTPMMLMGDEYGHTKNGNNNTYGHDNSLSWFQWNALEKEREGFFRFCAKAIHFRKQHPLLGREDFLSDSDVTWHESNWDDAESRFLMVQMHQRHGNGGAGGAGSLLAAFNAHAFHIDPLGVPPAPAGCVWSRVADTQLPSPKDFDAEAIKPIGATYKMAPYSSILFQAVSAALVPKPKL